MDIEPIVNLSWTDFQNNISAFVSSVQHNQAFLDVTLVIEDDYQISTNKVVLSASSLFFRKILAKNVHPHPLIYLRGIAAEDLESIMDFIFNGEVKIKQDRVSSFMSVAEDLQVKGFLEEFVVQNESLVKVQESNKKYVKMEEEEDGEQVLVACANEDITIVRNENTLDDFPVFWEDLGRCKYPALEAEFGVRYAKCNLCRRFISAEKPFLRMHWKEFHLKDLLPNELDGLEANAKTDTVGNSDVINEITADKFEFELETNPKPIEFGKYITISQQVLERNLLMYTLIKIKMMMN